MTTTNQDVRNACEALGLDPGCDFSGDIMWPEGVATERQGNIGDIVRAILESKGEA